MFKLSTIIVVGATLLLSACATNNKVYSFRQTFVSGVSFDQARAQCDYENHLQDRADVRTDQGSHGWVALLTGRPTTTQILCMNRFGFSLEESQANETVKTNIITQESSQQKSQVNTQTEATSESLSTEFKTLMSDLLYKTDAICGSEKYKKITSKMPCDNKRMDDSYKNISEKLSSSEEILIREYFSEVDSINEKRIEVSKKYGRTKDYLNATIFSVYRPKVSELRENLLSRQISIGEYNRSRDVLGEKMRSEMR